jgi:predicted GIY-YIG superfamily endonuclease
VLEINPKVMVLSESSAGNYELVFSEKGVIYDTIKIYTGYDYTHRTFTGNQISKGRAIYDEFGNLSKLIGMSSSNDTKIVYVIYDYLPSLYYNNIKKTWERRLAQDRNDVSMYTNQLNTLELIITEYTNQIKSKAKEKQNCISKFNRHMGTAIREGNWIPEDYKNCEDKYTDTLKLPTSSGTSREGLTPYISTIWDVKLFDGEQDI